MYLSILMEILLALHGGCVFNSLSCSWLPSADRTQGNGLKLCQGRVRVGKRKRFFTQRVSGH